MDNWTKLQLTELESVEDPGHGCTPLGLVLGDVEEVGGNGDQEDQHPHNHLQKASNHIRKESTTTTMLILLYWGHYLECKGATPSKEVLHHSVDSLPGGE